MHVKRCKVCKEEKSVSSFYKIRKKYYSSYCKTCARRLNAEWAKKNPERVKATQDRYWARNPEKRLRKNRPHLTALRKRDREYQKKKRADNPGLKTKEYREYRKKYPGRVRANGLLNYAIKTGKIKRRACEDCGKKRKVHGHHENYDFPLEVRWVCAVCHKNYKH